MSTAKLDEIRRALTEHRRHLISLSNDLDEAVSEVGDQERKDAPR